MIIPNLKSESNRVSPKRGIIKGSAGVIAGLENQFGLYHHFNEIKPESVRKLKSIFITKT